LAQGRLGRLRRSMQGARLDGKLCFGLRSIGVKLLRMRQIKGNRAVNLLERSE
jgi:hypothetical protein